MGGPSLPFTEGSVLNSEKEDFDAATAVEHGDHELRPTSVGDLAAVQVDEGEACGAFSVCVHGCGCVQVLLCAMSALADVCALTQYMRALSVLKVKKFLAGAEPR